MRKVLILQSLTWDGCSWYRLVQFAREANRQKLADVQFLDPRLPEDKLEAVIRAADCYLVRLSDFTATETLAALRRSGTKKPVILDIDDNYELIDPLSDMYQVYGTADIRLTNGHWLYKTGERGFDRDVNRKRLERYKDVMREATAVITTTLQLAAYVREYNENAVVIPNAIDPELYPELATQRDATVRLVWAGGASHYSDLAEIKEPLKAIMREFPQVEFHMLGVAFQGIVKDLPPERVKTYGWINADGHSYRLLSLRGDIGICPLKDMAFNYFKSSVKFYEYACAGMATVARNIPPYADDIQHDRTGLLYDTPEEFYRHLKTLITDPIRRAQLADEARKYVLATRSLPEITRDWVELIDGVCEASNHEGAS